MYLTAAPRSFARQIQVDGVARARCPSRVLEAVAAVGVVLLAYAYRQRWKASLGHALRQLPGGRPPIHAVPRKRETRVPTTEMAEEDLDEEASPCADGGASLDSDGEDETSERSRRREKKGKAKAKRAKGKHVPADPDRL